MGFSFFSLLIPLCFLLSSLCFINAAPCGHDNQYHYVNNNNNNLHIQTAVILTNSSNDDSPANPESVEANAHPFLEWNGLVDGSWFIFFVVAVAASRLATIFPRIGLPLITGYMIIGCLCGPYILNIVERPMIKQLSYVTQVALSFIAFSAGSELYLPELRSLFKTISIITGSISILTLILCTFGIWGLSNIGLMKWTDGFSQQCKFAISLLASSIMTARSPASAIAVVKELRAKGPVTSTMLGVTVVGDLVVLVLFTLSASIAGSLCAGEGFEGWGFVITIFSLIFAVGIGYLMGGLLLFLLWFKRVPARFTILPLGFLFFIFADWFAQYSLHRWKFGINLDALLVCITAGYVATNKSKNRVAFLQMLTSSGSYIFIPFFTKVGVELNLKVLGQSIAFAFLVWLMRGFSIFIGCYFGGVWVKWDQLKKRTVWLTMLAQAGVSLGLASEAAVRFPAWGSSFQTAIVGVVLLNQLSGPVTCKWALKKHQEDGKMAIGEDEHAHEGEGGGEDKKPKRKTALIIGVDSISIAYAQRMINQGWGVLLMDNSQKALDLSHSIILPHVGPIENQTMIGQVLDLSVKVVGASVDVLKRLASSSNINDDEKKYNTVDHELSVIDHDAIVINRLLNPVGGDWTAEINHHLMELGKDNEGYFETALISLRRDITTQSVASYLVDRKRMKKVLARVKNPNWAPLFIAQGIIPIFSLSLNLSLLSVISSADDHLQLTLPAKKNLPETVGDAIKAQEDYSYYLSSLPEEQRLRYESDNPSPTEQETNAILNEAVNIIANNDIKLFEVVPESLREDYMNSVQGLDGHAEEENGRALSDDIQEAEESFMSPALQNHLDEVKRNATSDSYQDD